MPLLRRNALARPIRLVGLAKNNPAPALEQPRRKGVAVLLAVLLGIFGAHLFYLGYSSRALTYLITTLVCIGLLFVAIPIANSAAVGSGIGGAFVGLYILGLGAIGIALNYLKALFDAVRILTSSLS
ncbi:MAG: TM2 domain-containing protein [Bacteroidota bacterium]|nr:TM2 domain-containing protein [Bacteroidota bacterium]